MKRTWIVAVGIVIACLAVSKSARADDCLEVGWRDQGGRWQYYRAWVDQFEERGRVHIKYDYHHGELELKVHEKERADGSEAIVLRGRWFEGRDGQRSGRVRLEMRRAGSHHARGWYTFGESDDGQRFDFVLQDCSSRHER